MKHKVDYIYLTIVVTLTILLVLFALFQLSNARSFQFFGGLTDRVATDKKIVALTFDDSPTEYSAEVLQTLKEKQVKATFYMIGNLMEKYPQESKNITNAGMELGNHSYSHPRFLLVSQSFIDEEVQKTNKLIRETGFKGEITFRPPYGKKLIGLPWYLSQNKIKTIMWDVEPDTYVDTKESIEKQTAFLVSYTMEHTQPGSIILLHPFCKDCKPARDALPQIIDGLKNQGYSFVTVSELLSTSEVE